MNSTNSFDLSVNHPWMGRGASGVCAGDLRPASGKVVKVYRLNGNDFVTLQTPRGWEIPCRFSSIVLA